MTQAEWRNLPAGIELDKLIYSAHFPEPAEFEDLDGDGYAVRWGGKISFVACVSKDADAAIALLPEPPNLVMIMRGEGNEWICLINSISSRLSDKGTGTGETVALAVCRAYLDWREHQDEAKR